MVTRELAFAVGYKSDLMWPESSNKVHQLVKRIAFNVELTIWPTLHQLGQLNDIRCANVSFIWTRVNRNAVCTSL